MLAFNYHMFTFDLHKEKRRAFESEKAAPVKKILTKGY